MCAVMVAANSPAILPKYPRGTVRWRRQRPVRLRTETQQKQRDQLCCICWFVVVVVIVAGITGFVTLDCSEVVVVLVGDEPQPVNTAMPASNATPTILLKRDVIFWLLMVRKILRAWRGSGLAALVPALSE